MRTKVTVAALTLVAFASACASASAAHENLGVRIVSTDGFYIDNDPAGQSGGDLFGSEGAVHRGGERVGRFASACTATSDHGGECNASFVLSGRGRLQLAGIIRPLAADNHLPIIGGSGDFRGATGRADLHALVPDGSKQRVQLHISR